MPCIATHMTGKMLETSDIVVTLPVGIIYNTDDPYALRLDFQVSAEEHVPWTVSIELFESALNNPGRGFGQDAVVTFVFLVSEARNAVQLELHSPEGEATIILPAQEVQSFIEYAHELAADGTKERALDAMFGVITEFLQEL